MAQREENEANLFAMHLLVPTVFLLAELKKYPPIDLGGGKQTEKIIKHLANKFKVSETVMTLRIGQVIGKAVD